MNNLDLVLQNLSFAQKKFMNDAKRRINLSKSSNMSIVSAYRGNQQWTLNFKAQLERFQVKFGEEKEMSCTCPYFVYSDRPCEHYFYIFTKFLNNEGLLHLRKGFFTKLPSNCYSYIDGSLLKRFLAWKQRSSQVIAINPLEQCTVCYNIIDQFRRCWQCKKNLHIACINKLKQSNKNMPCFFCRNKIAVQIAEDELFSDFKRFTFDPDFV